MHILLFKNKRKYAHMENEKQEEIKESGTIELTNEKRLYYYW